MGWLYIKHNIVNNTHFSAVIQVFLLPSNSYFRASIEILVNVRCDATNHNPLIHCGVWCLMCLMLVCVTPLFVIASPLLYPPLLLSSIPVPLGKVSPLGAWKGESGRSQSPLREAALRSKGCQDLLPGVPEQKDIPKHK